MLKQPVRHLSAYALIYEEETMLWNMRRQHLVEEADEELSLAMFDFLIDRTQESGWEHYEISN
ncbi:coproporphyrinogen III oxidase, partial [Xanthomonas citri pv. citri]|nr:coproporphyrinogen III oxidase [Xanthomonas citri pv. citri]